MRAIIELCKISGLQDPSINFPSDFAELQQLGQNYLIKLEDGFPFLEHLFDHPIIQKQEEKEAEFLSHQITSWHQTTAHAIIPSDYKQEDMPMDFCL